MYVCMHVCMYQWIYIRIIYLFSAMYNVSLKRSSMFLETGNRACDRVLGPCCQRIYCRDEISALQLFKLFAKPGAYKLALTLCTISSRCQVTDPLKSTRYGKQFFQKNAPVSTPPFGSSRDHVTFLTLAAGTYMLVPITEFVNTEAKFVIRVLTENEGQVM